VAVFAEAFESLLQVRTRHISNIFTVHTPLGVDGCYAPITEVLQEILIDLSQLVCFEHNKFVYPSQPQNNCGQIEFVTQTIRRRTLHTQVSMTERNTRSNASKQDCTELDSPVAVPHLGDLDAGDRVLGCEPDFPGDDR